MITKSEKLILKAFVEMQTPLDFDYGVENTIFIDSINGLIRRFLSGEKISIDEIRICEPNSDMKTRFSKILSNSIDNLIYYNLVKLCFIILKKYS